MAIGFNLPNGAFRLNAQEAGGQPDYMAALQSGLQGSQMASETVMKPQNLSEALLQAQLKNAHDRTINKYLPQAQEADIGYKQALARQANRTASMPVLTPYDKMQLAVATKRAEAEQGENLKEERELEQSYPQSESLLRNVDRALEITAKHPDWYGAPTPFLGKFTGAEAKKRNINDPEYGELESTLGQLVGPQAQALSGNRILASALGLAQNIKPGLNENDKIAYGKLLKIRKELMNSLTEQQKRYSGHGGTRKFGNYTGFTPRTSFESEREFHDYMKSLTPHQRNLVKIEIGAR